MKNFLKIAQINPFPLLVQLKQREELWGERKARQFGGSPHEDVDDIWLRFGPEQGSLFDHIDGLEKVNYPQWKELSQIRDVVLNLQRSTESTRIGSVLVTKLAPGMRIASHKDEGKCPLYYERYQIALQSNPGCVFRIEDEEVQFAAGDVWWINNKAIHTVVNNSNDDRIAVVVDLRADKC